MASEMDVERRGQKRESPEIEKVAQECGIDEKTLALLSKVGESAADKACERMMDRVAERAADIAVAKVTQAIDPRLDEMDRQMKQIQASFQGMSSGASVAGSAGLASVEPYLAKQSFNAKHIEITGFCEYGKKATQGLTRGEVKAYLELLKQKFESKAATMINLEASLKLNNHPLCTSVYVSIDGGTDGCWKAKDIFQELNEGDDLAVGSGGEKRSVRCFVQNPPWKEAVSRKGRKMIAILCKNGVARDTLETDFGAKFEIFLKQGDGRPQLLGDWSAKEGFGIHSAVLRQTRCRLGEEELLKELRA